jgi:hypothetical protein
MFGKAIQENIYGLVIIDGLQYANLDLSGLRRAHLLSFFCVKAEAFRIPIIATHRNPVPMDRGKNSPYLHPIHTHAEHWKLYRPAYYTEPSRKGESLVVMPGEPRRPDPILEKRNYLS